MSKHTLGPWSLEPYLMGNGRIDPKKFEIRNGEKGKDIRWLIATVHSMSGSETANAHLIAAAPEMLEALQLFVDCFPNGTGAYSQVDVNSAMQKAVSAMNKARGGK